MNPDPGPKTIAETWRSRLRHSGSVATSAADKIVHIGHHWGRRSICKCVLSLK